MLNSVHPHFDKSKARLEVCVIMTRFSILHFVIRSCFLYFVLLVCAFHKSCLYIKLCSTRKRPVHTAFSSFFFFSAVSLFPFVSAFCFRLFRYFKNCCVQLSPFCWHDRVSFRLLNCLEGVLFVRILCVLCDFISF